MWTYGVCVVACLVYRLRADFSMLSGFVYHLCMTAYVWHATPREFLVNSVAWLNEPVVVPWSVHGLYLLQLLYHGLSWKCDPHGRTGIMALHHVVTCVLIVLSWWYNYVPLGCLMMLIHDITDLPLYVVRACRVHQGHSDPHSTALHRPLRGMKWLLRELLLWSAVTATVVSWLLLRVWLLPHVIHQIWEHHTTGSQLICMGCLCALWVMHVYWYGLLWFKIVQTLCS